MVPKVSHEWRFYFIWIKKPISIPHRDYFVNEVEIEESKMEMWVTITLM